jgi:S1-C subfamily serine protease
LVNIFCSAPSGILHPVSGSGVLIDPRGVILTNAHVAQYLLLAESQETNLSCSIRWGSPARPAWEAEVLYIPPAWVHEHAADITRRNPTGTGEHDYALLRITRAIRPEPISATAIPIDTREGIAFAGDTMVSAGYPAEFIGETGAQFTLYPIASTAPVKELLTFESDTVDLISLEGVIEAQGGSSGGPVVNAWGRLVGLITTSSEGATTAERELRAITLSYISRDLLAQTSHDLSTVLGGDIVAQASEFRKSQAPALAKLLIEQILKVRSE